MEINVEASLFPHRILLGGKPGSNRIVARLRFKLKLTPQVLSRIVCGQQLRLPGGDWAEVRNYSPRSNRMVLESGEMKSDSPRHLRTLMRHGWEFDSRAARHHGIRLPRWPW
jgi:hypothetical protein